MHNLVAHSVAICIDTMLFVNLRNGGVKQNTRGTEHLAS